MSKRARINPSLVLPWSLSLSAEEPYEYPFKAFYQFDGKQLTYIAALHSSDPRSSTFQMVRDSLDNQKVEMVMLEGCNHSLGRSPQKLIKWASNQAETQIYEGFETAFAIAMAHKKNIPFVGGEPDDQFVHSQILHQGFTTSDLIFYHFVQQVFQFQESGAQLELESFFNDFIERQKKGLGLEASYNFSDFQKWYALKNGRSFVAEEISSEVPAPYENGKLFTQRVSSSVCRVRDQYIVTKIDELLDSCDSLLVIFGGSHWSTQKKALETAYGPPSFTNS